MARPLAPRAEVVRALALVFRRLGFEGASLAEISAATGLGKGSLYHFFPGGKDEMAEAVLAEIAGWWEVEVFRPLAEATDAAGARRAIRVTTRAVRDYFAARGHVCLFGAFALDAVRDRFAAPIRAYFSRWTSALTAALTRLGTPRRRAGQLAADSVGEIQGALVLCRALGSPAGFDRRMAAIEARLVRR